ncbi:Uncharacterized protein PECH_008800 [Penicillium ucsense]|uniref:Uncharacterized protein n=1 Tax=Penicillium ucsense TaxID=2839758 RepID=A0A8J8W4J4_9EURO|nr:Uncharacterized protein PECM_005117 [Penicillium ucsense]KAF7733936.1 Uncharacterized protein PECH_008800 [Penicillium ucsense]
MGGPYTPTVAQLGGLPTVDVDVPICAILVVAFLSLAICHMVILRRNLARGHKFIPSGATFGFCMSRIVANVMRIVWACYPQNIRVAIASQIFVAAGVLILFILNLLFAQRMLRAAFPALGWSRPVSWGFKLLYILIFLSIVMLITVIVQSMYTLNPNTHRIDRDIQLYGVTFFAIVSFLPLPMVTMVYLFADEKKVASFGQGSWRAKALVILIAGTLLCLGASYRAGTTWMKPRPINMPPAYMHKACFFIFDFVLDLIVVIIFLFARVDRRFYVPDGSSKLRHYRGDLPDKKTQFQSENEQAYETRLAKANSEEGQAV